MKRRTLDWILRVWIVVSIAVGITLVILGPSPLPIVGVLLIIIGVMSIMLAMQVYLGEADFEFIE
jgi:hypothetical protein